jgi:O-antigen ligase
VGFLFFPILFAVIPFPSSKAFDRILMGFVAGALVACFMGFYNAMSHYFAKGGGSPYLLYGQYFAYGIHRGYLALYLLFATAILLRLAVLRPSRERVLPMGWGFPVLLILLIGLFMTGSRTGLITLLPLAAFFIYKELPMSRIQKLAILGGILLVFLASLGLFSRNLKRFERILFIDSESFEPLSSDQKAGSVRVRLMVWSVAWELYKANWLKGVGTGDDDEMLVQAYRDQGYDHLEEARKDAHSQFLQTGIAIGLPGLLILVWTFFRGMVHGMKGRGFLLYLCLILFITAWVESILERQAGILFMAFFIPLLFYAPKEEVHSS